MGRFPPEEKLPLSVTHHSRQTPDHTPTQHTNTLYMPSIVMGKPEDSILRAEDRSGWLLHGKECMYGLMAVEIMRLGWSTTDILAQRGKRPRQALK